MSLSASPEGSPVNRSLDKQWLNRSTGDPSGLAPKAIGAGPRIQSGPCVALAFHHLTRYG